jgi:hypothetical protein
MRDKKPIEQAIKQLQERMEELRHALGEWDRHSVNTTGAKMYKEKARRISLQAQAIESLIKENVFPSL